ncbi:hypothetical protein HanPI659440_Chr03g0128881 [Helianthus annuus]|nr:hypothetical protein HanPI659440_Chr03g0128881 [Helianthus annuus]
MLMKEYRFCIGRVEDRYEDQKHLGLWSLDPKYNRKGVSQAKGKLSTVKPHGETITPKNGGGVCSGGYWIFEVTFNDFHDRKCQNA